MVGVTCCQLHQFVSTETEVLLEAECLTSFWRRNQEAVLAHTSTPKLQSIAKTSSSRYFPIVLQRKLRPTKVCVNLWSHQYGKGSEARQTHGRCSVGLPSRELQKAHGKNRGEKKYALPISSSICYWRSPRAAQSHNLQEIICATGGVPRAEAGEHGRRS